MKNIYETPKSELIDDKDSSRHDEEKKTLKALNKSESVIGTIIATIIVMVPTTALSLRLLAETMPILFWALPGLIVGVGVRLMAASYRLSLRLIPAVALFLLLTTITALFELIPLMYLLALTNSVIVVFLSRKKLTLEQEKAVWLYRQGKL